MNSLIIVLSALLAFIGISFQFYSLVVLASKGWEKSKDYFVYGLLFEGLAYLLYEIFLNGS